MNEHIPVMHRAPCCATPSCDTNRAHISLAASPPAARRIPTHWSTRSLAAKHGISRQTVSEIWRASTANAPDTPDLNHSIGDRLTTIDYEQPTTTSHTDHDSIGGLRTRPSGQASEQTARTWGFTSADRTHASQLTGDFAAPAERSVRTQQGAVEIGGDQSHRHLFYRMSELIEPGFP